MGSGCDTFLQYSHMAQCYARFPLCWTWITLHHQEFLYVSCMWSVSLLRSVRKFRRKLPGGCVPHRNIIHNHINNGRMANV